MSSSQTSPRRTIYKVRIMPSAERDLEEIYGYTAQDSPPAAAKFFHELRRKAETMERSPRRCAKIPEKIESEYEYRHLIVKKYRIIFRIIADTVWVMRFYHGARQLDLPGLL